MKIHSEHGKLFVLVGIPASGKSSAIAKLEKEHEAIALSSDKLREELLGDVNNQENGGMIFDTLFKRANETLTQGRNVIIDATNVNRRRRKHLIEQQLNASEYHAIYFCTSLIEAWSRDIQRERNVGYDVINKFYKTMDIPTKKEGWDSVAFRGAEIEEECASKKALFESLLEDDTINHDNLFDYLIDFEIEFDFCFDLGQDSTYHSFSVSRHTFYVFKHIQETYTGTRRKEMLIAALFHDIGKAHCKSFFNFKGEEKHYASFINHENVSAQIACKLLMKMGYEDEFIKYVVDLIQFHMKLMNIQNKGMKKLQKLVSEELLEDLKVFYEADLSAK